MMHDSGLLLAILASSFIPGVVIFFLSEESHRLRIALNLIGAGTKIALVGWLLLAVQRGETFMVRVELLPGIDLVLTADALSLLFATLSTLLWFITTIYAIGYLENSPNRSRFFGFFCLCVSATVGIALSGNLVTFLVFYELLTLATWPLVVHRGTAQSLRAGRIYLVYTLLGGAILLGAIVWLTVLAGSGDFRAGGYIAATAAADPLQVKLIFALLVAGFGVKAALVPLHSWLPRAMVAPAPVSALLHAVAVVKAGAFGIVRVVDDVYGIALILELGLSLPLMIVAVLTILYGSLRALFALDLKQRLAFSTVSQVSYIVLGIALAGPLGAIGGLVHLVHQGLMKITLFFCAGNFAETLGIHKVTEMNGLGSRMPWTMLAFTIGALGMIGMPPIAGFISKWYLGQGALEMGHDWIVLVLAVSSLLNAAYFLPLLYRGWFCSRESAWPGERERRLETHWMLLLPTLVVALSAIGVGVLAGAPFSPLDWVSLIIEREYSL
jgi:multicomponent Na+:H+ antiporter subunit D